jgi:AraC family ethanolamine operon transcriptional activator
MSRSGQAEAPDAPSGLVQHIATTSLEECDAWVRARGLQVRHDQMSQGAFAAEITRVTISPAFAFSTTRYATATTSQGEVAAGAYVLSLPASNPKGAYLNHRLMRQSEIRVLHPNQEFQQYRSPGFRTVVIFPDAALIERHCEAMFGRPLSKMAGPTGALSATDGAVAACARHFAQMCEAGIADQKPLRDLAAANGGYDRLAAQFIDDVLGIVCPPVAVCGWSARQRVVNRAWEIIEDDEADVATVANLCIRLGVPIRTLDDAFRGCLGVTPKQFIRKVRLNKVRRALNHPIDATTVTSAATHFGFFHFGHFASQYRELFGESPSQTLGRAFGKGAMCHAGVASRAAAHWHAHR